jgi:pyridoxamine 5'-phosphate oxidase
VPRSELFTEWLLGPLEDGVREPHALTVSTAGADDRPTAWTLLLKGVGPEGRRFASGGDSFKARDLTQRPFAAPTFRWSLLGRRPQPLMDGPHSSNAVGGTTATGLAACSRTA